MTLSGTVTRRDADGVVELRLDRPQRRNALSTELLVALRDHLAAIADDPACRAVLLTGAGAGFCSGADTAEFGPGDPGTGPLRRIRLVSEVLQRLVELEQPTIAAVHGPAVGAGWGLALSCDVCLASSDASFCLPELAKGFRIPERLMQRLVAVVGPIRAAELAFSGRVLSATEAAGAGCVACLAADHEELVSASRHLCGALAAQPRRSVATAKRPLRALAPPIPNPPPDLIWTEE